MHTQSNWLVGCMGTYLKSQFLRSRSKFLVFKFQNSLSNITVCHAHPSPYTHRLAIHESTYEFPTLFSDLLLVTITINFLFVCSFFETRSQCIALAGLVDHVGLQIMRNQPVSQMQGLKACAIFKSSDG